MRDLDDRKKRIAQHGEQEAGSPLEVYRRTGGRARRPEGARRGAPDSMIAVWKGRVTYTFILDDEVASIHFDRSRGEIFFRGHSIANMELSEKQRQALMAFSEVLERDSAGSEFAAAYGATLGRLLADNK